MLLSTIFCVSHDVVATGEGLQVRRVVGYDDRHGKIEAHNLHDTHAAVESKENFMCYKVLPCIIKEVSVS